jgi:hypothetical protein
LNTSVNCPYFVTVCVGSALGAGLDDVLGDVLGDVAVPVLLGWGVNEGRPPVLSSLPPQAASEHASAAETSTGQTRDLVMTSNP